MIEDAASRALAPRAAVRAQLAAIAVIDELSDRARGGHAAGALARIAGDPGVGADVRSEAALLARTLAPDEGTEAGTRADHALGVVDALAVLGPFRDTGGGLAAHDGPEADRARFGDEEARYSWGSYEVGWRAVPPPFAGASGVPLELLVFPRRESCSWLATRLVASGNATFVARVAAAGQVRLVFDGVDVGRDEAVHAAAQFDRLAVRVHASPGPHLLAAKVCTGALDDEGRVRLRVTDDSGAWPAGVTASASLGGAPPPRPQRGAPAATEPVATPLTRAVSDLAGGPDARLEGAILRTLGGADDLRSPRAPGILATLADGAVDADHLAMAGWIAPSGANRGAWLARARASAAGDAATRAFVDRRLVERHLEAGLADWAIAALRGSGIDRASDAEAALLAARVDTALGGDALRIDALHRLASFAASDPEAPCALLGDLADLAGSYDAALARTTRERLAARGDVGSRRVQAAASAGREAVVAAARRAMAGGVESADEALDVAQAVARAGAHADARSIYEQLARLAPNQAAVWAGLAEETGASSADAMRDEAVVAALRRARDLEPGEPRHAAELDLRTRAPAGQVHEEEDPLVSSQAILARRMGVGEDPPTVADRQLYWLRSVSMHADRRVSELVHYAREIVIPPRTEDELYENVPAEGDLTEIVRARVHRRSGETAFPVEEANEGPHPRIRWPELAAGDVVEVAFRSWTDGPVGGRGDPPFYRLDYAGGLSTHPVLYNEVVVDSPQDRPIYVDVVNGKADRRDEGDAGGRHHVRLVWDRPVNVAEEPLAPAMSEVVPTVVLSTFKDWSAFRAWYAEAVRGFTEPDAQVRDLAAKLTAGKASRDAKLRALFDFVADDIRYVNYVSGEWWLPNRPQQLLARREGDCDDKAMLLITLLRAVGVDAREVMVQTRLTGQPSILRAKGAAVPLFDHGIAFLPGADGGAYLDATTPQSRLGPLPSMDARALALQMDGPAEVVELPSSSPEDHGVDATWRIALAPDGGADLDGDERASGDDAFWLRTNLTEPGARAQWVEDHLVGPWFSTVEVDKKVDFRGDLPRGAATVRWHARSGGLARREEGALLVPLAPAQTVASQLAPLVTRTLPVVLPAYLAPRRETRTLRVTAPKGWTFDALPQGGEEPGGAFGRARLDVSRDPRDPRTVVARRTVVLDESTIPVADYPRWRAWMQRIDALMHKNLRLVPAGGGAR
jgi:hypothetical protein